MDNDYVKKPKSEEKLFTWISNAFKAVLIWLVGVLVLIPLSTLSIYWDLRLLITFIVFFSFSFFMLKALVHLDDMLEFVSWYLNYKWSERQGTNQKHPTSREQWRKGLDIVTIILIYLFYSPILLNLHQAVNGIALILIILVGVFVLIRKV